MHASNRASIDRDAVWNDLMALAAITDPTRPYTRRSFSPLFQEGREWLERRFHETGLSTHIDAAGNLIGRRRGRNPSAGVILVGSHSDSVPSGGRFDGIAGVAAGLGIARALSDRDIALNHSLEIVDFLAEEPSEYGLSCIGSRGITGNLSAEQLALRNVRDEPLGAAIARMGGAPDHLAGAVRRDISAAFELHIEQGPVLEAAAIDIGIVTSIVGITRLEILFEGAADHAGTTPMDRRRDALVAAATLVTWIRATAETFTRRGAGHFVATAGIIEISPNATNVVPKIARLVIDARAESRVLMEEFVQALDRESRAAAGAARVDRIRFERLSDTAPAVCDGRLRALLGESAKSLGLSSMEMASGAGHDMAFLSLVAPASMVFIPCKGGRSHCPEEWASPDAVAAGSAVILDAILRFDDGDDRPFR